MRDRAAWWWRLVLATTSLGLLPPYTTGLLDGPGRGRHARSLAFAFVFAARPLPSSPSLVLAVSPVRPRLEVSEAAGRPWHCRGRPVHQWQGRRIHEVAAAGRTPIH